MSSGKGAGSAAAKYESNAAGIDNTVAKGVDSTGDSATVVAKHMDIAIGIVAHKKELRREFLGVLKAIPAAERLRSDELIRQIAAGLPRYRQARRLFLFVGDGWEVDTRPLIEIALADGKQVAVPRCLPGDGAIMEACLIRSLSELRRAPPLGLWEPPSDAPALQPSEIDVALIPCIACDRSGRRLGRGGGYYDRFLSRSHFIKVALCRSGLLREELPTEAHDENMDIVVTETGALCFIGDARIQKFDIK